MNGTVRWLCPRKVHNVPPLRAPNLRRLVDVVPLADRLVRQKRVDSVSLAGAVRFRHTAAVAGLKLSGDGGEGLDAGSGVLDDLRGDNLGRRQVRGIGE